MFDSRREYHLKNIDKRTGPVVYVMSREVRVNENWGLLVAQRKANELRSELYVVFEVLKNYQEKVDRNFSYLISGLKFVAEELYKNNIHFILLTQESNNDLTIFIEKLAPSHVYVDFSPLRRHRARVSKIAKLSTNLHEIDSHNIVPCRHLSSKQEYSAYTFRLKYLKVVDDFVTPFPKIGRHEFNKYVSQFTDFPNIGSLISNETSAKQLLTFFLSNNLSYYAKDRNDPNKNTTSKLSLYLHYGFISSQFILEKVQGVDAPKDSKDAFIEQLTIRKELSDNYCLHNSNYDNYKGLPSWGIKTLTEHIHDKREHIYSQDEFEEGKTYDSLWNSCQNELVSTGWLHGYLRMYWAKKILEWTIDYKEAHSIAVYLNDKYQLDGRDPNGYVGVSWSVGGLHDRPWFEKPIFGLVRTMTRSGAEKKFDVNTYIKRQAH
jgi:deoxyribodipyrimidine photo-lyase